ncbi:unnamed protein product, partial [Mesorhabditis spiculigera]
MEFWEYDEWLLILLLFGFAFIAGIAILFVVSWLTAWPKRSRSELLRTEQVYDPTGDTDETFDNLLQSSPTDSIRLYTPAKVYLSVVIPAMNERERLPKMLDQCIEYLDNRKLFDEKFTFEVIVVDDGSTDGTADLASKHRGVKVLKLEKNRGKGGAVRAGMLNASGKLILFADADGATEFPDFKNLEDELIRLMGGPPVDESFPGISIGSRAHLEEESKATRPLSRTILMVGFHLLVQLFAVRTVRDTQCGFKLFTRGAVARLFPVLHIERWAFDVELLYLCELWNLPIAEVAVRWREVDGSKITPVWSWIQMGRDLVLIWFRYSVGIWTAKPPK